jgi:hypothetical protein
VIRFGVVLSVVLVAIGLLVAGVVAGSLKLVAISIGVAVLAFLLLIGVVISFRHEIFGRAVPQPLPARAAPDSPVLKKVAAEGVAVPGIGAVPVAAARAGAPGPSGKTGTPAAQNKAGTGKQADAAKQVGAGQAGTGPGDGGKGDGRRKATGVRTKAPGAEPVTSGAAALHRPGAASTAAGRTGPGKPAGDRPDSAPVQHQDRAEPHRASRLERESARAAVGKAAAPSAAAPDAGDRPAAAKAGSQPESDAGGTPSGAKARVAGDKDRRQQEQRPAGAADRAPGATGAADAAGAAGAQPRPAMQASGGPASKQKPGERAEPNRATVASAAGSAAGTPADADRSEQSADADRPDAGQQAAAGESSAADDSMQVSVVPGITRYHRSDCLLIRFLSADDLEVMTKRAATDSGCVPCKACKPD